MKGIKIDHVMLSGTQTLSSAEMSVITSSITGSCFDESDEDIESLIRDQFQERGYFGAKVKHIQLEPVDPLAIPKPVDLTAEVTEGPIYHLSKLVFSGTHAFSSEQLVAQFPVKTGDVFNTQRIRGGLNALRRLYGSEGYLDFQSVPATQLQSDQTVDLTLAVSEGQQYRMGKLQVLAQPEQRDALELRWSLREGAVYDAGYVTKFVDENKNLLPPGFNEWNGAVVERDCRDATVTVSIIFALKK